MGWNSSLILFVFTHFIDIITYLKSRSFEATETGSIGCVFCQFSEAMASYEKGLALDPERGVLGCA